MKAHCIATLVLVAIVAPLNAFNWYQPTAEAKRVCFPKQWEGYQTSNIPSHNYYVRSKVSVDTTNKRIASKAVVYYGRHTFNLQVLVNWAAKKQYFIYKLKNKKVCRVLKLKKSLPANSNCLPSAFRKLTSYNIGVGKNSLTLDSYSLFSKRINNIISLTKDNIPVRDSILYSKHGSPVFSKGTYSSSSWYNISSGIRNKNVFNVPKECNKKQDEHVFQFVNLVNFPKKYKPTIVNNMFEHITAFETAHQDPQVVQMQTQIPSGAMHILNSGMHNIVDYATKTAKRFGSSLDGHFTQF